MCRRCPQFARYPSPTGIHTFHVRLLVDVVLGVKFHRESSSFHICILMCLETGSYPYSLKEGFCGEVETHFSQRLQSFRNTLVCRSNVPSSLSGTDDCDSKWSNIRKVFCAQLQLQGLENTMEPLLLLQRCCKQAFSCFLIGLSDHPEAEIAICWRKSCEHFLLNLQYNVSTRCVSSEDRCEKTFFHWSQTHPGDKYWHNKLLKTSFPFFSLMYRLQVPSA